MSRYLRLLLQSLVTGTLLVWILNRVDFSLFMQTVQQLSSGSLLLILLLSFLVLLCAARRSQLLSGLTQGAPGLWAAYRFYLAGMFYNQFLPTSVGGDVVRIYLLHKQQGDLYRSSSSVLLERLLGLTATLFISLAAALALFPAQGFLPGMPILVSAAAAALTALLVLFHPRLGNCFSKVSQTSRLTGPLFKFIMAGQQFRHDRSLLLQAVLFSLAYQLGDILVACMLGRLVGIELSVLYFLFFIPIVYIVTLVPISINGLGVRENAMVFLFAGAGAEPTVIVFLSLLVYADRLLKGMVGGLLLFISGWVQRQEAREGR